MRRAPADLPALQWWAPLLAGGLGLAALASGALGFLDTMQGDVASRLWAARGGTRGDIAKPLVVGVGEPTLAALGPWPLARRHYGELLRKLAGRGARVVAFDILFDRPAAQAADDMALAAALRETGAGVLALFLQPVTRMDAEMGLEERTEVKLPVAPLAGAARAMGFVNIGGPGEEAAVIRRCRLVHGQGGRRLESLPLATARAAGFRGEALPGDRLVRYGMSSPAGTLPSVEMIDVLRGADPPGDLSRTPVLVGAVARSLGDVKQTPLGPIPGVEVNANILMDLLWAGFLEPLEPLAEWGLIAVVSGLGALALATVPAGSRVAGGGTLALLIAALAASTWHGIVGAQALALAALPACCLLPRRARAGEPARVREALDRDDPAAAAGELRLLTEGLARDAAAVEVLLATGELASAERLLERLPLEGLGLSELYRLGRAFESRASCGRARDLYGLVQRRDLGFADAAARFLEMDARAVEQATVLGPEGVLRTLEATFDAVQPVGAGASGLLYRAVERETGETVAVKVLEPRLLADAEALARFRRETAVLERLVHPGIVRFRGATLGKLCYYRMDFVEGQSLAEKLTAGWRPSEADASSILRQAAEALAHAHEAGVLHRDLKPSNLMFDAEGRLIVVDFGIAAVEGASRLTREGSFVGTLAFAAPEQLRGEPVDARADVYALGAVMRQLAGGERDAWPLAALVVRMTSQEPADRPAGMREVMQTLGSAKTSG
ncbi:MAG: CHASE2 domain-containing protein [Candidatus Wallbacteria bacterium]|nr:CHASE2 domain-containing protein [Candidatus Wallbacteria bacterium]